MTVHTRKREKLHPFFFKPSETVPQEFKNYFVQKNKQKKSAAFTGYAQNFLLLIT